MRKLYPQNIRLSWKEADVLKKYYALHHPEPCPHCASSKVPKIECKKFSNKSMAKFTCPECNFKLLVIDWER